MAANHLISLRSFLRGVKRREIHTHFQLFSAGNLIALTIPLYGYPKRSFRLFKNWISTSNYLKPQANSLASNRSVVLAHLQNWLPNFALAEGLDSAAPGG